jgi:hypothetical protein
MRATLPRVADGRRYSVYGVREGDRACGRLCRFWLETVYERDREGQRCGDPDVLLEGLPEGTGIWTVRKLQWGVDGEVMVQWTIVVGTREQMSQGQWDMVCQDLTRKLEIKDSSAVIEPSGTQCTFCVMDKWESLAVWKQGICMGSNHFARTAADVSRECHTHGDM